jgi:hypothetical protein
MGPYPVAMSLQYPQRDTICVMELVTVACISWGTSKGVWSAQGPAWEGRTPSESEET